ncbi:uncharacterized protein DS421_4g121650 [Arachis hypogaea]|nr:uncharacterized protein DS421_4g121650 [Arachis hypogaea]
MFYKNGKKGNGKLEGETEGKKEGKEKQRERVREQRKKREKWIVIGGGGDCRRRKPSLRVAVEYTDQRETRAVSERKLRPRRRSIVTVEANLVVVGEAARLAESSLLNAAMPPSSLS